MRRQNGSSVNTVLAQCFEIGLYPHTCTTGWVKLVERFRSAVTTLVPLLEDEIKNETRMFLAFRAIIKSQLANCIGVQKSIKLQEIKGHFEGTSASPINAGDESMMHSACSYFPVIFFI